MKKSRLPRPRRTIPTWELDDFFREVRRTVVVLENAWRGDRLNRELESLAGRPEAHPSVLAAYRRLGRRDRLEPAPYRGRAVHALLDEAKRELFELPHRFDARPIDFLRPRRRATNGAKRTNGSARVNGTSRTNGAVHEDRGVLECADLERRGGISVTSPRGEVFLRIDQLLSARAWGIQFAFEDPEVSDDFNSLAAHHTVDQLCYGLIGLEKIERRFASREVDADLQIVPPHEGRGFETLVCDILNEHYPCARQAPLYEDFFEKTDLRLHVRGLERRRGARAQVTRIVDPVQHSAKLDQIHNLEEFVILSPLTLARAVCRDTRELGWTREDELLFWQCFPDPPTTEEELAVALRGVFLQAMARPAAGPRGPLAAVPEPVRLLVQSFAAKESFRTTDRLRRRLAEERTMAAG